MRQKLCFIGREGRDRQGFMQVVKDEHLDLSLGLGVARPEGYGFKMALQRSERRFPPRLRDHAAFGQSSKKLRFLGLSKTERLSYFPHFDHRFFSHLEVSQKLRFQFSESIFGHARYFSCLVSETIYEKQYTHLDSQNKYIFGLR
jgi:hypothetical protein